jgi:hypothetical protein
MDLQTAMFAESIGIRSGPSVCTRSFFLSRDSHSLTMLRTEGTFFARSGSCSFYPHSSDGNPVYNRFCAHTTTLPQNLLPTYLYRNCIKEGSHAMPEPLILGLGPHHESRPG